ncbi:TTAGGG repeat binding factor [Agyrium rufum]|nr:TTAGGG repeat binding factor [Agyrium rufum]
MSFTQRYYSNGTPVSPSFAYPSDSYAYISEAHTASQQTNSLNDNFSIEQQPSSDQAMDSQDSSGPPSSPPKQSSKDFEEPDPTSRPRLTSEQTLVLERHFDKEPKPLTETKKKLALQVGLPLDKVNNWYQNRRAKAKHQKKLHYLEFIPRHLKEHEQYWAGEYGNIISGPFVPPTTYLQQQNMGIPTYTHPNANIQHVYAHMVQSHQPVEMMQLPQAHTHEQHHPQQLPQSFPQWTDISPPTPVALHQQEQQYTAQSNDFHPRDPTVDMPREGVFVKHEQSNGNDAHQAFSEWTLPQQDGNPVWSNETQAEHAIEDGQLLLQQSALPYQAQEKTHEFLNDDIPRNFAQDHSLSMEDHVMMSPQQNELHEEIQSQMEEQVPASTTNRALDTLAHASFSSATPAIAEHLSRTASASSSLDLTNNLEKIHFTKVRTNEDENRLAKSKSAHGLNLAARRNRQRPAALGTVTMRSHSATSPRGISPGFKNFPVPSSTAVRRIKSLGTSLNVLSGRVQKNTQITSAQRSPLNFSTFQDAGAFDEVEYTPQTTETIRPDVNEPFSPRTPNDPLNFKDHTVPWSDPNSHTDSIFDFSSHDGSQMLNYHDNLSLLTSPPHTPFGDLRFRLQHQDSQEFSDAPPQSAPPHMMTFPNHSSPSFHATPVTPLFYDQQQMAFADPQQMGFADSVPIFHPQPLPMPAQVEPQYTDQYQNAYHVMQFPQTQALPQHQQTHEDQRQQQQQQQQQQKQQQEGRQAQQLQIQTPFSSNHQHHQSAPQIHTGISPITGQLQDTRLQTQFVNSTASSMSMPHQHGLYTGQNPLPSAPLPALSTSHNTMTPVTAGSTLPSASSTTTSSSSFSSNIMSPPSLGMPMQHNLPPPPPAPVKDIEFIQIGFPDPEDDRRGQPYATRTFSFLQVTPDDIDAGRR